jgi:ketosteroid isomerase-like protein
LLLSKILPKGAKIMSMQEEGTTGSGNAEQEIRDLDRKSIEAFLNGTPEDLKSIWADDFVWSAEPTSPDQLEDLAAGHLRVESADTEDVNVRIHGDAAVLTGYARVKGEYRGEDISGLYAYTDTYVKQGDQWKCVAAHGHRCCDL